MIQNVPGDKGGGDGDLDPLGPATGGELCPICGRPRSVRLVIVNVNPCDVEDVLLCAEHDVIFTAQKGYVRAKDMGVGKEG